MNETTVEHNPAAISALIAAAAPDLADAVGTLLTQRSRPQTGFVLTVTEVAERLAVSADWVYRNKERLGALKIGAGRAGALRFNWETVVHGLRGEAVTPTRARRRPARPRKATDATITSGRTANGSPRLTWK